MNDVGFEQFEHRPEKEGGEEDPNSLKSHNSKLTRTGKLMDALWGGDKALAGELERGEAIDPVDTSVAMRTEAARRLGEIESPGIEVKGVLSGVALTTDEDDIMQEAVRALYRLDPDIGRFTAFALSCHGDGEVRCTALDLLAELDPEVGKKRALEFVESDPDDWVRDKALDVLFSMDPGAARSVCLSLDDSSPAIAQTVANILERVGDQETEAIVNFGYDSTLEQIGATIGASFYEEDSTVRMQAVNSFFGACEDRELSAGVAAALTRDRDSIIRLRALNYLSEAARPFARYLAGFMLEDSDPMVLELVNSLVSEQE